MRLVLWRWRTTSITFRRTMLCQLCGSPHSSGFRSCARRSLILQASSLPATFAGLITRWMRDPHVGAVVVHLLACFQCHDAEQHDFREARGVFERAGSLGLTFAGVHPIHFVSLAGDARKLLRRLSK